MALVDDEWFEQSPVAEVLGLQLPVCPAEEMIWSKAFVLERERFDGADVLHVVRDCGPAWTGSGCCVGSGRSGGCSRPPGAVRVRLPGRARPGAGLGDEGRWRRLQDDRRRSPAAAGVCRGTLLSREQYLVDVERLGYMDGRLVSPEVHMSPKDVAGWTEAIPGRKRNAWRN